MARNSLIKFLRATRSALNTQRTGSALVAGEPYLITDEGRLAVATAANAYAEALMLTDKQTSTTDGTVGRLMGVGAFGLGSSVIVADANLAIAPGHYIVPSGAGNNCPDAGSWDLLISGNQSNAYTQMAFRLSVANPLIYVRNRTSDAGGTWNAWRPLTPEYGSSADGNWIKHANGVMECWGTKSVASIAIDSPFLGGFRSTGLTVNYPQTFISGPPCFITGSSDLSVFGGVQTSYGTATFGCVVTAVTTQAAATRTFNWHAIGKWY